MKSLKSLYRWFKEKSYLERWAFITTFGGISIFSWFVIMLILEKYVNPFFDLSLENASNIGSFVGGFIGSFFTLVGVFLLFENLSLQRKELSENRELISQQQFESTLFNLLESQRQITNELFLPTQFNESITGRRFFNYLSEHVFQVYKYISEKIYLVENRDYEDYMLRFLESEAALVNMNIYPQRNQFIRDYFSVMLGAGRIDSERKILKETYFILFKYFHTIYGHYFRNLYHILKFIYKNEQEELSIKKNKKHHTKKKYKEYADIVQAQLSSDELLILFFNGLCFEEMKKLIHYYSFLENLSVEDLIKPIHSEEYAEEVIDEVKYPEVVFKLRRNIVQ